MQSKLIISLSSLSVFITLTSSSTSLPDCLDNSCLSCSIRSGSSKKYPDIVVLGFDTTLTYEKLSKACHYIRNGCTYFGINPDWNCPIEGGAFIPDCGSMAKLIEASTGRFPEFFGKPSKHTQDYIIQQTGYEPDEIAIVGDRLYTDIAVADQSDVTSILVLSGESTREDVKTSDVKPNVILEDLSEITKML